jgi:hypothetical protein
MDVSEFARSNADRAPTSRFVPDDAKSERSGQPWREGTK